MSEIVVLPQGSPDTVIVGTSQHLPYPIFFDDTETGQSEAASWAGAEGNSLDRRLFRCKLHPQEELVHVPPDAPRLRPKGS